MNLENTYRKLVWVDPVVFRKLYIELYVKITFFKGVTILWHPFASNYTDTTCHLISNRESIKNFIQGERCSIIFFYESSTIKKLQMAKKHTESQIRQKLRLTRFDYFARGVFHHNLTSIKVLECELKSTQSFDKSNLICHVQIIPISLEHLQ